MTEPILDDDLNPSSEMEPQQITYASFWSRAGATLVDFLVLIPIIGLSVANFILWRSYSLDLVFVLIPVFYKILMEWKFGATVGKMAMGIKVVNQDFQLMSLDQSFTRYALYFLSIVVNLITNFNLYNNPRFQEAADMMEASLVQQEVGQSMFLFSAIASIIIIISVLFVAFDQNKQSLHDKIAQTYVIMK